MTRAPTGIDPFAGARACSASRGLRDLARAGDRATAEGSPKLDAVRRSRMDALRAIDPALHDAVLDVLAAQAGPPCATGLGSAMQRLAVTVHDASDGAGWRDLWTASIGRRLAADRAMPGSAA